VVGGHDINCQMSHIESPAKTKILATFARVSCFDRSVGEEGGAGRDATGGTWRRTLWSMVSSAAVRFCANPVDSGTTSLSDWLNPDVTTDGWMPVVPSYLTLSRVGGTGMVGILSLLSLRRSSMQIVGKSVHRNQKGCEALLSTGPTLQTSYFADPALSITRLSSFYLRFIHMLAIM